MKSKYLVSLLFVLLLTSSSCANGGNPIILDPNSPDVAQLAFVTSVVAVENPTTLELWLGAPAGTADPSTVVNVFIDNDRHVQFRPFDDGSLLYKFAGTSETAIYMQWIDPSRLEHREDISVSGPPDRLVRALAPAGYIPLQMEAVGDKVWVLDQSHSLYPYDLESFIHKPGNFYFLSEPYSFDFSIPTGIVTAGNDVYTISSGGSYSWEVDNGSFREFTGTTGCAILGNKAWVANMDPIHYFPIKAGPTWVSVIDLQGTTPSIIAEIDLTLYTPLDVITDGSLIYVSCNGTINSGPPYLFNRVDPGGVFVIDPSTNEIIKTYDLGLTGPGSMQLSPDKRFLYVGSTDVTGVFRIDLEQGKIVNGPDNPIYIAGEDVSWGGVSVLDVTPDGLLVCGNSDRLYFVDSRTGEVNPFPFFKPVEIGYENISSNYLIRDVATCTRGGVEGLLILTSGTAMFHWLPL